MSVKNKVFNTIEKKSFISLEEFMQISLHDKEFGYYRNGKPLGAQGDFITSPEISQLYGEMIGLWLTQLIITNDIKQFNLIELGPGNGTLMTDILRVVKKLLKKIPFIKIHFIENNIHFINRLNKDFPDATVHSDIETTPNEFSIYIANEFFDALPIKQFIKIKDKWHERYVEFINQKNQKFLDIPYDMQNLEKKIKFKISSKQKFIEYSPLSSKYLKDITDKIKLNDGGVLIVDYGYIEKEMKDTLHAISKHKYIDVLKNFGNSDITYNLSFHLISKIIKKLGSFYFAITTQKEFLTKLGILKRAEILSKNMLFSKKADMYFRIKRLIDDRQMGNLFKVVFITNKKNKFKLGF